MSYTIDLIAGPIFWTRRFHPLLTPALTPWESVRLGVLVWLRGKLQSIRIISLIGNPTEDPFVYGLVQ